MRIDKPRPALAPADAALAADAPADRALQEGRVDDAAALLRATLAANPGDAVAHQLLCRVFYAQDMADRAIQECELAVSNTPASSGPTSNGAIGNGQTSAQASVAQMWLGRAYGFKAERTAAGEQVETGIAYQILPEPIEQSFAHAVWRRAQIGVRRE